MRTQYKVNHEGVKNQRRKNSPKRVWILLLIQVVRYDPLSDNQSIDR
jgi:hypothetical protein